MFSFTDASALFRLLLEVMTHSTSWTFFREIVFKPNYIFVGRTCLMFRGFGIFCLSYLPPHFLFILVFTRKTFSLNDHPTSFIMFSVVKGKSNLHCFLSLSVECTVVNVNNSFLLAVTTSTRL